MPSSPIRPGFIQTLACNWPFTVSLPGCQLVTACFDPAASREQDLLDHGLQPSGSNRKRQGEFLAGRLCAAQALGQNGQCASLPTRDSDTGLPVWPDGWCGSITHSHGLAAAIAGPTTQWSGLGLDIERLISPKRALRLCDAILTPDEQHWLHDLSEDEAARRLTLIFSAKESLYKAINPLTRTYFGFQDARITEYAQDGWLTLQLLRDLSDTYRCGMEFPCLWTPYGHGMLTLVYLAA